MAGWPENQWELWKLILKHRPEVKQIATLSNIPVGLWLYFGEDYVELSQVKRAMVTWVGGMHARGYHDSANQAVQFLSGIPGVKLKAPRRKQVQQQLVGVLVNGLGDRPVDQFRAKLVSLLSPSSPRRRSLPAATLEGHVEVLLARLEAARRIRTGEVPDSLFYWARTFTQYSRAGWAEQAGPPTPDELFPNACLDLTTTIGLSFVVPSAQPAQTDSLLNPEIWKDRQLTDRMTSRPRVSPLVLPTGERAVTGIEVQHSVTSQAPATPDEPGTAR
jgi:hypothetical protein